MGWLLGVGEAVAVRVVVDSGGSCRLLLCRSQPIAVVLFLGVLHAVAVGVRLIQGQHSHCIELKGVPQPVTVGIEGKWRGTHGELSTVRYAVPVAVAVVVDAEFCQRVRAVSPGCPEMGFGGNGQALSEGSTSLFERLLGRRQLPFRICTV
ncbi:hypothetical protein ASG92_13850 [Arthrobacter sp. Soil736]|nr:hypothetical protein ASG92_13850 [Arthrobacter sp. Soil736]